MNSQMQYKIADALTYEITYNAATGGLTPLGDITQHYPGGSVPRVGWYALNTTLPRWLNTRLPRRCQLEGALPGALTQHYTRATHCTHNGCFPIANDIFHM